MASRNLFGGAITAVLPERLVDVSDLRQVPDNQEVFLYPDSNASIVIEVLQRVSQSSDADAVKFHFEALAHDNDAISNSIRDISATVQDERDEPYPILLRGTQTIRKFNSPIADDVEILMALFRIQSEGKSADLVVSASIPTSSGGKIMAGDEAAAAILADFTLLVLSLRIVDYALFR